MLYPIVVVLWSHGDNPFVTDLAIYKIILGIIDIFPKANRVSFFLIFAKNLAANLLLSIYHSFIIFMLILSNSRLRNPWILILFILQTAVPLFKVNRCHGKLSSHDSIVSLLLILILLLITQFMGQQVEY